MYGWTSGSMDSHLIKNDEWGAVAYLCYSKYGEVPKVNACGNFYTGAGPYSGTTKENAVESGSYEYTIEHAYNTANGMLASTTGNVYGIYDMPGASFERVAGYLDNGNAIFGLYGKSTTDSNVTYFEQNEDGDYALKSEYKKYWNKYEVSEEEKNNAIKINDSTTLNNNQLWNKTLIGAEYNAARLRITTETYNKMASYKGIGVNELARGMGYYGAYSNGTTYGFSWFTDAIQPNTQQFDYGVSWDNDQVVIGHGQYAFVRRGGLMWDGEMTGVLCYQGNSGDVYANGGFRPAIVVNV